MKLKKSLLLVILVASSVSLSAQVTSKSSEQLIAESQTGAMPLFFEIPKNQLLGSDVMSFRNKKEFTLRGGLPNFFRKTKAKKPVIIGYFGGSITRADNQYRLQSAAYIQRLFPDVVMKGINAGVSGTGTDLGACRLYNQILQYKPDLVFVEFAVNGGPDEAMEGIIRQLKKYNPKTDICLIYTITQTKPYTIGEIPDNIARLEKIAAHYNLPSIHLGLQAAMLEKEEKLLWKGSVTEQSGKIIFSSDGVHPSAAGGNLYASAIARAMVQLKGMNGKRLKKMPTPLLADNWEDANMVDPLETAQFSKGWTSIKPTEFADFKQFESWFPYIMKAENAGESFSFKFEGKALGIFDIGGPEAGQLELTVDGKNVQLKKTQAKRVQFAELIESEQPALLNRFNTYCKNRYRGQFDIVELEPGIHTVELTVSAQKADKASILGVSNLSGNSNFSEKYQQNCIYIGKILLRGKVIK